MFCEMYYKLKKLEHFSNVYKRTMYKSLFLFWKYRGGGGGVGVRKLSREVYNKWQMSLFLKKNHVFYTPQPQNCTFSWGGGGGVYAPK